MKDKRDQLYDNLINSGKVGESEIGNRDEFKAAIKDEATSRQFYNNIINSGLLSSDEIGSEDDFFGSISQDFSVPSPGPGSTKQPMLDDLQQQPVTPASATTPVKNKKVAGYTPTPQEMAGFRSTIQNAGLTAETAVPSFDKKASNLQKRQGLKTPTRVNLGETNNLVEGEEHLNPKTGQLEKTYITSQGNEYNSKAAAEEEQRQIDDYDRRMRYATGQAIDDLSKKYVNPLVDKAIKDADDKWFASMAESSSVPMGEGMELHALRRANKAIDPDQILQGLQKSLEGMYKNPEMQKEISRLAESIGVSTEDYLEQILAPSLAAKLENSFASSQIAKNMPKNSVEYILQGMSNSIGGMLMSASAETRSQRAYKNQAEAMTESGDNPYYTPGTGAKLAQLGVSFAADAPFFGMYGRVSGQVAKKMAERQIQKIVAKGLSEGAARSIVGTALENSVGARMKNYLMQHVVSSSLTMGAYNATSETARQTRDSEFDPLKVAGSTAEGLATGAAFGVTGGAAQALSQPLRGISKVGAKLAGFGAEAETMYATEELAKMLHGEEGFTNPFEGSAEALMKLGVMKVSGGHLLESAGKKIMRAKEVGVRQTAAESLAEMLGQNRTGVKFSKDEEALIRNSAEGRSLLEALSNMHPEKAISEVNGKKRLTPEGEEMRRSLSDSYNAFMENPEYPATVKQKVAHVLGGVYSPGLETGADIVHNSDGSVVLKTRDKDGNRIREIKFDNFSDADAWRENVKDEFRLNDAVNMWNATANENRSAAVDEVADMFGVSRQEAKDMVYAALDGKDTSLDRDQYNAVFGAIERNAYPADEYDPKQRYREGKKMSAEERHKAQVDVQVAEEWLAMLGQDFANEVKEAAGYADEKLAELATRKDITGEQLKAAVNYYNATARVSGMMDEALKGVYEKVEAANAEIQRNTHPDSGALIEVTRFNGKENKDYYLSAGHIELTPDGKVVSSDGSGMVILRDKNTGEIEVMNPNTLTVTAISDPKRLMEANRSMEGLYGQLIKQADDSIEYAPGTPDTPQEMGETFVSEDGKMYMVAGEPDETGNVTWLKVELDADGNPTGKPQPLDIDEYRKAKSNEIDAANMPQEETAAPVGDIQKNTVLEAPEVEQPASEGQAANIRREDEGEGARVEAAPSPERQEQSAGRIPVDEKGRKLYEQSTPEETMADLTAEFGEEKARQMISKMVENTEKALAALQEKDTSNMTDMNDIGAYEKEVDALQGKLDFWQSLLKEPEPVVEPEAKQEAVNNETVQTETQPVKNKENVKAEEVKPAEPEKPVAEEKSAEPEQPVVKEKPAEPEQSAKPTAEQKIAQGTVKNNIGKQFSFHNQDGTQSEIVIKSFKGDDMVEVVRQDYDVQGRPKGDPYSQDLRVTDVGNSIVSKILKPVLSVEERLRQAYKGKKGMQNVIDVLSEDEQRQMLDAIERGDEEALRDITNDLVEMHREDIILNERDKRNANVSRIMDGTASREEKLRRVRKEYEGFDDAVIALSDEAMQPTTIEEYVADLHSRQPKSGEGPLAYFTYDQNGRKVVGMQDETGYGTKTGGDANGFKPWLAPKGKGMSLQEYAEQIHSQLPESIKEQYSDQDVRNAILNVFGGAERPSDITTMLIKRGVIQAEQAARRMEEMWIDGPSYQKVMDDNSFASRLQRGKQSVNTEPTEGQKEAGNYKKGHISFGGYDFTIENPEGSMRRGKDATGRQWEQKMNNTYGYILGKYGKDGDHLDMFINDSQDLDNWNGNVYIVDQVDPKTGKWDEHKILYGFDSLEEAKKAYLSNYQDGWKGLGNITGISKEGFDKWVDSSKRKMKKFADHSITKEHMVERDNSRFDSALKQLDERDISIDNPDLLREYGLKNVTLSRLGDHLSLTHFIVDEQGKGHGTRFMEDLARLADEKGWTLTLTPDTSFGGTSVNRLKNFYKRFGFVNNKGRNTDFFTRDSMIRRPKDYEVVSPERQEEILRNAVVDHLRQQGIEVSTDWKLGQKILDDYNSRFSVTEEADGEIKPQKVTDQNTLDELNNGKTVKRYRAMQLIDGKLYPPMSAKVDGEMREPTEIGVWEQSEERPDMLIPVIDKKTGKQKTYADGTPVYKFKLDKAQKGQTDVPAAYNPYFHTSTSGLNDQFTSAYKRPELVVVEVEIPESELTSGYKARYAKDAVGNVDWHSGVVNGQLPADRQRQVTLSRYSKVNRIVPDNEVADMIVKQLEGTNVEIPYNVVTPQLRKELENRGVKISEKPAGSVTEDINGNPIKNATKLFKTSDGHAYGYTYQGKIYVDPRIATSETPIHEYSHLWSEMKRQTSPEEWNNIKQVMLTDKLVQPIIERVRRDYPELAKEDKEDDFIEEIITQFSGKRGSERLREIAKEVAEENGGIFGKAEAVTAMQRLKNILNRFWEGIAKMMSWKYTNANQIADRIMADMLNDINPGKRMKEMSDEVKSQQEVEHTLMGVHNLSEEKLKKALKQGGLANPSLAVIDTNNGMHSDYGEISLIPRSSMIDARTGRNAGTFTADAWTPTYPKVEKRMSDKGQTRFWKDIRDLNKEVGEIANRTRMAFDTWLDKEVGEERLAYWYLKEKGMSPETAVFDNPYTKEATDRLDKLTDNGHKEVRDMTDEEIREIADMYHAYKERTGQPVTPAEERIKKINEADLTKDSPFTRLRIARKEELEKYGELLHNLSDYVWKARRASVEEGKVDADTSIRQAYETVKEKDLEDDFKNWLNQKAEQYGVEEWIYNGTDNQGRQRYVRNTLDNASRLMKKEGLNGAVGWSSIGSWIATVAKKEKTLEGIRRNKKNLNTTEEQHDKWREDWGNRLYPIAEKLGNGDPFHGDNVLKDILEHDDYAGYYKREYGKELTKEEKDTIASFIDEVRENYPTGYFETKFERPVGFEEFEIAVVPETTSPEVVEALKKAGLDVRTYDASDYDTKEENRRKVAMDAVTGRDDIRFQLVGKKGAAEADKANEETVRMDNLKVAEEMEKEGKNVYSIWAATGWNRGKDGQWRYETPDADADVVSAMEKAKKQQTTKVRELQKKQDQLLDEYGKISGSIPHKLDSRYTEEEKAKYREMRKRREQLWKEYQEASKEYDDYKEAAGKSVSARLADVIGEDNELFKYYPELKDLEVRFMQSMQNGVAGSFGEDGIELNVPYNVRFNVRDLDNESLYGTLLHEIQHAVQHIEGFAPGGNLYTSTTDEGIKDIVQRKEVRMNDLRKRIDANRRILNDPESLKLAAEMDGRSEEETRKNLEEQINNQAAEYDNLNLQIERLKKTKAPAMSDARDLYHRIAGEVEARNATERYNMSDISRRHLPPSETEDVSREDQVVIMDDGTSMSFDDIKPIDTNRFGGVYDQFKGKVKEAFDFLVKKKDGYLKGVFRRDDLGDIDLAWGSAPTNYTGKGLAHIIRKHIEVLKDFKDLDEAMRIIKDVVDNGTAKPNSDPKLVDIEKGNYRVVLAKNAEGNWILSAFDFVNPKKEKAKGKTLPPSKTPGQSDVEAGAVTSNLSLSGGKDTKNIDTLQEKTEENTPEMPKFQKVGGDVDSDNFKKFFGDWEKDPENASKVVDSSGKPMVVYHQTDNDFTVFDPRHEGAGTRDHELPFGIFMKPTPRNIGVRGEKQMPLYANIRKPLRVENRQELSGWLKQNIDGYKEAVDEYNRIDQEYSKKFEEAEKADHEEYVKNWNKWKAGEITEEQYQESFSSTAEDVLEEWKEAINEPLAKAKKLVDDYFRDSEYDGVWLNKDEGSLGRSTETIITLDPNQVKSATKNSGEYNPENPDIRYQRTSNPEPEMTPEERQYWNKWNEDMRKWKERNAIAAETTGPGEKPKFRQGENAMDFAKRLVAYNRERALWQTAPKLEDYHQKRSDKETLEAAREFEKRYPDSPSAKMRRVAAEFQQIRHAMSQQKAYDKATVKAVTDFAQEFMKQGFGDHLSRGEMERLLSSVKNATGAKDIRQAVDNIMNILVDNQLRNLDQQVQKLSSTKELSKTAQGVEKQGKLELKGQRMIQAFRQAREGRMDAEKIRERLAEVAEKMARDDDEAPMWEQEYEGLQIALQYQENIEASRDEYAELDRLYKDTVKDYKTSGRSYKDQQELLESIDRAMMENKVERIGLFGDIIGRLQGNISESIEGAKNFVEREKERVRRIQQIANFDLAGKPADALREKSKGKPANFFLQPLGTFEQMLKQFGSRNANGEGYLYNHFMRSWIDSVDKSFENEQKAKEELDTKAREVFGNKVKRWSDLYDIARNLPSMEVEVLDGEEPKTFKLNQGNLLYIYMADKMTDGRMKLRKMGIDEETVEKIKDFLDPRLVELGDWLQDDYLVKKRTEYNKVHERMFGAPMAAIDHYFPLKVLGDARYQEQDVANMADQDAVLPSTITGNIIKRRKNALPLDILHTDALSLAIEHVEDMERWATTAEWNRDINTLLSYTTFRNKVKNMKTVYGSGDALWNNFADTARMAAGTYRPKAKPGSVDAAISNIAKGVTAAKINFRVYTAFKQLLSAPAFLHDVRLDDFVKNSINPYGSWKWAMENMPVFKKRWKSRQVGDTRLMDDPTDWKLWKTNIVQMATRMGISPNALVDGVTCAVGARSIYESRYRKYKKIGASDEVARKRALQDAEIGYNLTQQSSEGAFTSAIQKDRTVAANMLSVFRNSSMSYTRQWYDAYRNLKKRMQKGYKEDSIKFMTRQFQEQFDLDDAQAKRAAELEYAREGRRDVARMLNMMFGVTMAWNLGASLPYLLFGDDNNTKKEMLTDAILKGMVAGPTEGFAAGNIWSDLMGRTIASEQTRNTFKNEGAGAAVDASLKQGGDYEINPLPLMADLQSMIKKMGYDKYAAAQDVFNIVMQSAVGVNPQTFTDMWNAAMDYGAPGWDGRSYSGDNDLSNAKEIALFMMRLLNAPSSSWKNKYIDELGMNADDAKKLPYEEMARRYAHYKHWKDAPIMGWLRGEEGRAAKINKLQQQFDKSVEERMQRLTDDELRHNVARSESPEEKRRYAKMIAKRLGVDPGNDSQKSDDKKDWYQKLYQERMMYDDIVEDEMLADKYKNLENHFKEKREEAERKSVQDLKEFNEANKDWKNRIDEAKKEAEKRMDWIRGGKWNTQSGKKGNSKNAKLLSPGKKQLETSEDTEVIMRNIRQWRKEALEMLLRAEAEGK